MKTILKYCSLLLVFITSSVAGQSVDMRKRAEDLKGLKWGMFVCWSFSTFSGKEWTPGIQDVAYFKATGLDTDQWARTAKEAGMGYILFLAKHHDGFCLWDTQTTDRKVTKAPLGRDVLAELKKSCDKHGIKLALYFSEGEWRHPGGLDHPDTKGEKKRNQGGRDPDLKKAQLKELLTQYGPIEYIWFDHAVGDGGLSHAETIAFCKALQPGCFIGFNHGDQQGADIRLGERGKPGPLDDHKAAGPHMDDAPSKNYLLAEFTYPILPKHDGGADWFYSLPKHDGLCHSAAKIHQDYVGALKFGNIFSINLGPGYDGKLREIDVRTLREVGAMIRGKSKRAHAKQDWAYLDNGTIRIGVDKSRGSAIGYFALSKDQRNLLNHHDEGRFIQQSYYGDPDGSMWAKKPWMYNPVQGGSYKGEDARTLDFKISNAELFAKVEPLHWASAKACPEAIMEQTITLDGPLAKIHMRMAYSGPTQNRNAHQEMPAMFVDYLLPYLMFEREGKLVKHTPADLGTNMKPEGIRYDTGWLAFVDDKNFGIGIHTPGTKDAVTYRHKGNGSTGANGSACSYVAPVRTMQLKTGVVVDYEFYLTIGTLQEIRARFAKLAKTKG